MSQQGDDYPLKADEAEEWARNTSDHRVRKHFKDLAMHFRDMAKTVEGRGILIYCNLPIVKH